MNTTSTYIKYFITIGIISGSGTVDGIEANVSVEKVNPANDAFSIEITDGTVSLVKSN